MFLGEIIAQKCKEKELLGGSGLQIFFCINVGNQNEKNPVPFEEYIPLGCLQCNSLTTTNNNRSFFISIYISTHSFF